jgi:hypothetical protein
MRHHAHASLWVSSVAGGVGREPPQARTPSKTALLDREATDLDACCADAVENGGAKGCRSGHDQLVARRASRGSQCADRLEQLGRTSVHPQPHHAALGQALDELTLRQLGHQPTLDDHGEAIREPLHVAELV